VKQLIGVDPDGTMLGLAAPKSRAMPFPVECIRAGGESLPLADGFADTVVVTYAFCTIPDLKQRSANPAHPEADGPAGLHRHGQARGRVAAYGRSA